MPQNPAGVRRVPGLQCKREKSSGDLSEGQPGLSQVIEPLNSIFSCVKWVGVDFIYFIFFKFFIHLY